MNEGLSDKVQTRIVTAKFVRDYMTQAPEQVFRVDKPTVDVAPGDIVEILIECEKGFSVFIPHAGFFGDHVFEAVEQTRKDSKNAHSARKVWSVRLTRTMLKNENPSKEMAYCIYSKDLDNFAVGNSPPKMNLNP